MALARDIIRQSVRRQELMSRGEDAARSGSPSGETRKSWAREEVWAEVLETHKDFLEAETTGKMAPTSWDAMEKDDVAGAAKAIIG